MAVATSRRRVILLVVALLALQALVVCGYFFIERRRDADREPVLSYETLHSGRALPLTMLESSSGRALATESLHGRPVLLHFWATWCPPCREELPALLELHERDDLVVIAISLDDDWTAVERFFDGRVPPEVVRDPARILAKHYEVGALPDSYLLDTRGIAIARFGGPRRWDTGAAVDALDALLQAGGAHRSE